MAAFSPVLARLDEVRPWQDDLSMDLHRHPRPRHDLPLDLVHASHHPPGQGAPDLPGGGASTCR